MMRVVKEGEEVPEWLDFICEHVMFEDNEPDPRIFRDDDGKYGRLCIKCVGD